MKQAKQPAGKPKFSAFSAGGKIPAHFYGANGFPVECYSPLLDSLSQRFDINSLWHRPLWPGQQSVNPATNWQHYATDLIKFLESRKSGPVVAIGHSMGATATVMAALQKPKLFSRLVLIEPVIQPTWKVWLTNHLPKALLHRMEPVKSTLLTPEKWKNEAQATQFYQNHAAYKRIPPKHLSVMVESMVEPVSRQSEEVCLRYSRGWEATNYMGLRQVTQTFMKLKVPSVIIQGKPNLFCDRKLFNKIKQAKPDNVYFEEHDYGHLIPLEAPELTRQLIISGLNQLKTQ